MTKTQATDAAIRELKAYKTKKPRSGGGTPDDTDELITRAKTKKAMIEAEQAEQAAQAKPAESKPPPAPSKQGNESTGALPPAGEK
jgi:hypothetical protein